MSSITGGGISSLDKKVDDVTQKLEGVANDVQAVSDIPLLKNGVVKSVQMGVFTTKSAYCHQKVINLGKVNPDKILVITQTVHGKTRWTGTGAILEEKTSDSITLKVAGAVDYAENEMECYHSWQVIEFY